MLIFSDASCGDEVIGFGYVIQINGERYSSSGYLEGDYTSMESEYLAMMKALRAASFLKTEDDFLMLYTDCDPLIDKMSQWNGSKKWNDRRKKFLSETEEFECNIRWLPRNHNTEAHELAHSGLRKGQLF